MRIFKPFLIAVPLAFTLWAGTAPAFWHGAAMAASAILSLVTGNVVYYVNPSAVSTSPCGVNGGSTCQPGSDSNTCLSISAPCLTFQRAVFLMTQTWVWGINLGRAQIFLAHGTFNEVVLFPPTIGAPAPCSGCGFVGNNVPDVIEIAGDDSSPSSVVISAPNGSCTNGGPFGSGVLTFIGPNNYYPHGFTTTAVNEATNLCYLWNTVQGATVYSAGALNFGQPANGGCVFQNYGGILDLSASTLNVTVGTGHATCFDLEYSGSFIRDFSTINFVGTNVFNESLGIYPAVDVLDGTGSFVSAPSAVTFTGTVTGNCFNVVGEGAYVEETSPVSLSPYPGCTFATNQQHFQGGIQQCAAYGGLLSCFAVGSNNMQDPVTVTGTGCTADSNASDLSGKIIQANGSIACDVTLAQPEPNEPDCFAWIPGSGTIVPLSLDQSSPPYTSFTLTHSSSGTTNVKYQCLQHF